ncbi:HD domain-containing protein [Candidatus Gottesmanbacteria bacterium]|nr:HD domain-containing protein [Candidatus Gottesmanbacteria bacterium]
MTKFIPHHHYKGDNLSRSEKVERRIIELIITSKIPDSQRESSVVWELKHSSGCLQIARILSEKRKLDIELSEIASVLHDIYVIIHGTYKNHAKLGAPIAEKLLIEIGGFTKYEIATITSAIAHHSEKDIYTDDPYIELVKDADVFDCSLYKGAEGDYRINKPTPVFKEYVKRIQKVRRELGMPTDKVFRT